MALDRRSYKGNVAYTVTLASSIVAGDTSIGLSDGSTFPDGSAGPYCITIDAGNAGEEKVKIASRTGNTLTVASSGRGYDGTTAASHASGVKVFHTISAVDLDEANQAVVQTIGKVTTAGDLLVGSGANAFKRLGLGTALQVLRTNAGATDLEFATPTSAPVSSVFGRTGAVAAASADYTAAQVTNAADKSSGSQQAFTGEVKAPDLAVSGLTGAVNPARIVGAVNGAAPASGTFAVGDVAVDITGGFYICTTAGTPGTWTAKIAAGSSALSQDSNQLSVDVSCAAGVQTLILTTASLATGKWLLHFGGSFLMSVTGGNVEAHLAAGTATASFTGASAAEGFVNASNWGHLSFPALVNVTGGGTLTIQCVSAQQGSMKAQTSDGFAGATGYTAIKVG